MAQVAKQYSYASREEALAHGVKWSYGYADDPEFQRHVSEQLPEDFKQYDLELFFFLNYLPNQKRGHKGFPTDVPRDEHWWRAAERRWPTIWDEQGRPKGDIIRDEWSEKAVRAISGYDTVCLMGGSGQGKTTIYMAHGVMMWDYFAHTKGGCRFQFSSVSERKINDACWAYCRQLYVNSNRDCSPNISNGQIFDGSMEIRRKGKQYSLQGIIRGVLITNDSRAAQRIDSLTGAHEPECQILVTDEAQSSPDALSRAGTNLRTHADWFWELLSGNPDDENDYLGKRAKPDGGWEKVDTTRNPDAPMEWEAHVGGKKSYTIRFDNDFSPGMDDPIRYWYRPTRAFRDREYPTAESRKRAEYHRFWKGTFVPGFTDDSVIKWSLIEQMGCHTFAQINQALEIINFMSFDSAPASMDRSPLGHFQLVYEGKRRLLNCAEVFLLPKLNPDTFDRDAADLILKKAVEWQVASGNMICDFTNRSGPLSVLQERGFLCRGMIYNLQASDKPVDPQVPNKRAKEMYGDLITEAAFLLEAFIRYGQVRGLNDSVLGNVKDEICSRKTQDYPGGKVKLEQKANRSGRQGFRDRMGFSPDIFDIFCQAAWFAREHLGLWPGIDKPLVIKQTTNKSKPVGIGNRRYYAR